MIKFKVVKGRKGPKDKLVKVWAYGEVFPLEAILRLLDVLFKSEDSCYPIKEGCQGKAMLLKAIIDVYSGISVERVLKSYKLERKGKRIVVIEKLKETTQASEPIEIADFI